MFEAALLVNLVRVVRLEVLLWRDFGRDVRYVLNGVEVSVDCGLNGS